MVRQEDRQAKGFGKQLLQRGVSAQTVARANDDPPGVLYLCRQVSVESAQFLADALQEGGRQAVRGIVSEADASDGATLSGILSRTVERGLNRQSVCLPGCPEAST